MQFIQLCISSLPLCSLGDATLPPMYACSHVCLLSPQLDYTVKARVLISYYSEYKWLLSAWHVFPSSGQRTFHPTTTTMTEKLLFLHSNYVFLGDQSCALLHWAWGMADEQILAYTEARVEGSPLFPLSCPPGIWETLICLRPHSCQQEKRCSHREERCQGNRDESK